MKHSITTAVLAGILTLSAPALAQEGGPGQGGPAINSTVFTDAHINAVTSVTEVFGPQPEADRGHCGI